MGQLEVMVCQLRFEGEAHTTCAGWDEERDCVRTLSPAPRQSTLLATEVGEHCGRDTFGKRVWGKDQ